MTNRLQKIPSGETVNIDEETAEKLGLFTIKVDVASASITYYGWAQPGVSTAVARWKILRKSISGNVTTYSWADGDREFDNIWDNRASLSYDS